MTMRRSATPGRRPPAVDRQERATGLGVHGRASRSDLICVALATALAVLSFVSVAVVVAGYAAETRQMAQLSPRFLVLFPDEEELVRGHYLSDAVDGQSVRVLLAEPVRAAAPPPPGLKEWPAPGHYLSSAALDSSEAELSARWGTRDGTVPDQLLGSRNTRFIIARPAHAMDEFWAASGFGIPEMLTEVTADVMGSSANRIPMPVAVGGVLLALAVPALAFLVIAVQSAKRSQSRSARILELLGAPPWQIARRFAHSLLPAVGMGLAGAAALSSVVFVIDVPLPLAEFTIRASDMRAVAGPTVLLFAAGTLIAVLAVGAMTWPSRLGRSQAGTVKPSRIRPGLAGFAAVAIIACTNMAYSTAQSAATTGDAGDLGMWLALSCLVATLGVGPICWAVLRGASQPIASVAASRGRPSPLLVGRGFRYQGGAKPLATAGALAIVIVTFTGTWTLAGSVEAVSAQRVIDRIAGSFYLVTGPQESPDALSAVSRSWPAGVSAFTLDETNTFTEGASTTTIALYGDDAALAHWQLTAGATEEAGSLPGMLGAAIVQGPDTPVTIHDATPPDPATPDPGSGVAHARTFVAFRLDGHAVDRLELQRAVSRAGGPAWSVGQGGELWIVGARDLAHSMRWVPWFAALGTGLTLAAFWLACVRELRDSARRLIPLDVLYSRRSIVPRVVALRIAAIATAACAVGATAAVLIARTMSGDLTVTDGALPFVAGSTGVVLVVSFAAAAIGAGATKRMAGEWRPGENDAD